MCYNSCLIYYDDIGLDAVPSSAESVPEPNPEYPKEVNDAINKYREEKRKLEKLKEEEELLKKELEAIQSGKKKFIKQIGETEVCDGRLICFKRCFPYAITGAFGAGTVAEAGHQYNTNTVTKERSGVNQSKVPSGKRTSITHKAGAEIQKDMKDLGKLFGGKTGKCFTCVGKAARWTGRLAGRAGGAAAPITATASYSKLLYDCMKKCLDSNGKYP
jgi:hypothetical protein